MAETTLVAMQDLAKQQAANDSCRGDNGIQVFACAVQGFVGVADALLRISSCYRYKQ